MKGDPNSPLGRKLMALAGGPTLPRGRRVGVQVELPPPPSANDLWRSVVVGGKVRVLLSRPYRDWRAACLPLAAMAGRVASPVTVRLTLCGVHRGRDGDNFQKAILDLLREAQVIEGDNLTHVVGGSWCYAPARGGRPTVVVDVMPAEGERT